MLYADGQGHRRRRGQTGRPHAHRRRNPIGQVPRRPPRRPAQLPAAAALRLRVHRRGHAIHQRPGAERPQPGGLHLPPPRRTDPAGQARQAGSRRCSAKCRRLHAGHLWRVQIESIQNLETSLAANRPRALIQMATGSGKTFTAVNFCYRLIKFAEAKRILFLVDRNNLGKQTLNEFQQFVSPVNSYKFTEEYTVQHLEEKHHRPRRQGLHHDHPAALLDAQRRGRLPGGKRGRLAVRDRHLAVQRAAAGRLQPEDPHRDVRFHRRR